jgi:AbrB family looped-hinge helix DNA binding protein
MQVEVASVSTKGQVVIPGAIRKSLGITSGSKLMVMTDGENVLMKPIQPPRMESFRELLEESRKAAAEASLTPDDVQEAIRETRRARRR